MLPPAHIRVTAHSDSLFQEIFVSQSNAWQIDLAGSMYLSKQFSAEDKEQRNLGDIRFTVSPQEQRASKHQGKNWTCMNDLSVQPLPRSFSCRGNLSLFLTQKVKQNSEKINLTFKISCSCLKTAWTSSCKSHLNSSSYVMEK